jgi:hypothetical protein
MTNIANIDDFITKFNSNVAEIVKSTGARQLEKPSAKNFSMSEGQCTFFRIDTIVEPVVPGRPITVSPSVRHTFKPTQIGSRFPIPKTDRTRLSDENYLSGWVRSQANGLETSYDSEMLRSFLFPCYNGEVHDFPPENVWPANFLKKDAATTCLTPWHIMVACAWLEDMGFEPPFYCFASSMAYSDLYTFGQIIPFKLLNCLTTNSSFLVAGDVAHGADAVGSLRSLLGAFLRIALRVFPRLSRTKNMSLWLLQIKSPALSIYHSKRKLWKILVMMKSLSLPQPLVPSVSSITVPSSP